MIKKIKEWWFKPRQGKAFEFIDWVMTNPQAFEVLLAMSHVVSFLVFASLTFFIGYYSEWNIFAIIIPGIFTLITIKKIYKYIRMRIKLNGGYIFEDLNLDQVTGNKYTGGKNGSSKHDVKESNRDQPEEVEGDYRYFSKRIQGNNR